MLKKFTKSLLPIIIGGVISSTNPVTTHANGVGAVTGFAIPRFISSKSNPVNVRTGPGRRYPVRVVYKQKIPLQIVDEYLNWRKIRDWDGQEGWVHKVLLSHRRLAIINTPITGLYKSDNLDSALKAKLGKKIIIKLDSCDSKWCYVDVPNIDRSGYVKQQDIWGLKPSEIIK